MRERPTSGDVPEVGWNVCDGSCLDNGATMIADTNDPVDEIRMDVDHFLIHRKF